MLLLYVFFVSSHRFLELLIAVMKLLSRALFLIFAVVPSGMLAQNTLTVHQKDGQQFSFGFSEKPVVSYTDNDLVIKSTKADVQYPLATVAKFTFDEVPTAVNGLTEDVKKPTITLDEFVICISGAKADVEVRLISSDGKILQSCKTDKEGTAILSIADYPEGMYIISSENLSVKILKK